MSNKNRLDRELVARGLVATRARDAVLAGHVAVDGAVVVKPGQVVAAASVLPVSGEATLTFPGPG